MTDGRPDPSVQEAIDTGIALADQAHRVVGEYHHGGDCARYREELHKLTQAINAVDDDMAHGVLAAVLGCLTWPEGTDV